jgi:hypothetical protein
MSPIRPCLELGNEVRSCCGDILALHSDRLRSANDRRIPHGSKPKLPDRAGRNEGLHHRQRIYTLPHSRGQIPPRMCTNPGDEVGCHFLRLHQRRQFFQHPIYFLFSVVVHEANPQEAAVFFHA